MNITKTEWPQDTIDRCNEAGGSNCLITFDKEIQQPEFGLKIGWNEPKKLWKPYIVLYICRYTIQLGWLF